MVLSISILIKTDDRLFTDEDCVYPDAVMQGCFDVYNQNGTNSYDVMEPIHKAEFTKRGTVIGITLIKEQPLCKKIGGCSSYNLSSFAF